MTPLAQMALAGLTLAAGVGLLVYARMYRRLEHFAYPWMEDPALEPVELRD